MKPLLLAFLIPFALVFMTGCTLLFLAGVLGFLKITISLP